MKKTFNYFLILAALLLFATSCGSDNEGSAPLSASTISAKWDVSSQTNYASFEFNKDGNYIVVENPTATSGNITQAAAATEPTVHFGKYQITDNVVKLVGLGTMVVTGIVGSQINFNFATDANPELKLDYTAIKAPNVANSAKTDLFCRTWKITAETEKVNGVESIPARSFLGCTALFSHAGTYLMNYQDGTPPELALWKWKNTTETEFYYSWKNWEGFVENEHFVIIAELTKNSMKINESQDDNGTLCEYFYELIPAN
ncbi:MAG: hypothetical protein LBT27_04975 [Prevotellaceae bacterium]|jgi:hypothetical protein|nr:hypothetical protein [Prevotellaceae bacterium]